MQKERAKHLHALHVLHGQKIRIVKVTLKEELEILRGEPIQVFTGDPMDIPCTETSGPSRLCKHPVVSVNMITYNHEPYIRQAIEGALRKVRLWVDGVYEKLVNAEEQRSREERGR